MRHVLVSGVKSAASLVKSIRKMLDLPWWFTSFLSGGSCAFNEKLNFVLTEGSSRCLVKHSVVEEGAPSCLCARYIVEVGGL